MRRAQSDGAKPRDLYTNSLTLVSQIYKDLNFTFFEFSSYLLVKAILYRILYIFTFLVVGKFAREYKILGPEKRRY